jgi:release factor family 7
VLALSLHNVRLFEGNADTMNEIQLNFPNSMEEALRTDEPEKYLNLHSGSISLGQGKGGTGVFHGHDPSDQDKTNIRRFFQFVDDGLNNLLEAKNIPMVLSGVDYLLPIYREASSYQILLEDAILGNPDREKVKDLHTKAWKIVQPLFEESQKKASEKFEQLNGQNSDLAVKDIKTAVKAATFGQVETIFVPLGRQGGGRDDTENNQVISKAEPGTEHEDLFDLAATQTILNSGQVFAVPPEKIPGGGEVAAILRYPVVI